MTWQDLIGTQIAGRYTLRTLIYAASHQSEFLAASSDTDEKPVLIALVEPEPGQAEHELAAITEAMQLRHPNLLQILDAGECVLQDVTLLFIVTEPTERTLARTLESGPLAAPAALLEDTVTALEWLHAQGLVYRNLAPDTIVRADGRWKLADLSQLHPAGEFDPILTASRTVPPEAAAGSILPAWDVWALGILLHDAIAGERRVLPAPFDAIVHGCLEPDPERRLSLSDIRKILKPGPVLVPNIQPIPQPQTNPVQTDDFRSDATARLARLVIAPALVVVALLAFLFFRHGRNSAPSPVTPPVSHPVAPPIKTPATATTPAPASTLPPAPIQAKPTPLKAKPAAPSQHTGRADYFSDDLEGHPTASGETFRNQGMTAANRDFPIGTRLRVTNLQNGHRVVVRINDRGPHRRGFIISVTRRAAEQLGFVKTGSARVKLEVVK